MIDGMGWFLLWITGSVSASAGFLILALPSTFEAAKAAIAPTPFTPHTPYALLLAGAVAMVIGVIGMWRSLSRPVTGLGQPKRNGPPGSTGSMIGGAADAAALAGFVSAVAAVLGVIVASTLLAGPCGASGTTGTCLSAHPDFYQQDASGFFFSTAPERLSLPLALAPGLVSGLALSMATARRRTALFGLILASLPLVAFGALLGLNELRFLGGGFD